MTQLKVFSWILGAGGSAVIYSFSRLYAKETIDCHECRMKRLPKAHELPLYEKKNESLTLKYNRQSELPFLSEISSVRQQVFAMATYFDGFKDEVLHIYETGIAHSKSSYDYLISEENRIPRMLAIASGGFVGYVLSRKRGIFRKLVFISLGTSMVFSAFYPALAKEYASTGWEHTKFHTSNVLEKYGGYDSQKLANETKEKAEFIKSSLKLESVTNQLKEWFEANKEKAVKGLNIQNNKEDASEKLSGKETKDS